MISIVFEKHRKLGFLNLVVREHDGIDGTDRRVKLIPRYLDIGRWPFCAVNHDHTDATIGHADLSPFSLHGKIAEIESVKIDAVEHRFNNDRINFDFIAN